MIVIVYKTQVVGAMGEQGKLLMQILPFLPDLRIFTEIREEFYFLIPTEQRCRCQVFAEILTDPMCFSG